MDFASARKALAAGKHVRRQVWITRLKPAPLSVLPQWDLAPEQLRLFSGSSSNPTYTPTDIDAAAQDWVLAP
jgi:hypothetical protein